MKKYIWVVQFCSDYSGLYDRLILFTTKKKVKEYVKNNYIIDKLKKISEEKNYISYMRTNDRFWIIAEKKEVQ